MEVLEAKNFAIRAHKGQVRKSEREKPMVIHPIMVANILKEYGYDDNVVMAGYLHDVVEDTDYNIENIKETFGEDVASLVYEASEPDKSKSWEERKKHTIENTKNLDIRHKALICADKISNLEDLRILFEKKGKIDFSNFNKGFKDQKWYYENVYESLIYNEDINNPMFVRLKKVIDHIFNNKKEDDYIRKVIFKKKDKEYNELVKLHYKKLELVKMKDIVEHKPYVIELTGTPRTGKTTIINTLEDFFRKGGFKVIVVPEFTTSKIYKEQIFPTIKNESNLFINSEIPKYIKLGIEKSISENPDIIIVDRGLFDRLIWIDRLKEKNKISYEEYETYNREYLPIIEELEDFVICTYAKPLDAICRDYTANLSLEERSFLSEEHVKEYNNSMNNVKTAIDNISIFDTTDKSIKEISIGVANRVVDDMRLKYIENLNKELN